ncbi:glycosyltransferase family 4 protein [Kocuria coralli]|nr:glycosyltransferase family 4 protein [Kocuria coralli]
MSSYLESTSSQRTSLEFIESGGAPGPKLWRLKNFAMAMLAALRKGGDGDVWVLQLASGGSTWRKLLVSWVLRARKKPYLLHLHGAAYPMFLSGQPAMLRRAILSFFQHATAVLVLGYEWRDFVSRELRVTADRLVLLPNAVPGPEMLPTRSLPVRVLFAGRVGVRKGAPTLLQAWAQVETSGRAVLVLAGDLDDPDGTIAEAVKASTDVEVLGWLDSDGLREQMALAQVLVLPSQVENLPLSLLEGMAWGLAPVVTPVGAVAEVVQDGRDGLLVPVDDADALAAALRRVISDDDDRARLARSARQRWETGYTLESYRPRFDDIVEAARRRHTAERIAEHGAEHGRGRRRSRAAQRKGRTS